MHRRPLKTSWVGGVMAIASCAAISSNARAQDASGSPLWELGGVAFGVSQQAYPGSDQQVKRALALPYVIYCGELLRADRDTVGIRALKTQTFEIDIGVAGAFGANSGTLAARVCAPRSRCARCLTSATRLSTRV